MAGRHVHASVKIEYRGKPDSVVVECHCGETAVVGLWYEEPLAGWSVRQWPKLREAIESFLAATHCRFYKNS